MTNAFIFPGQGSQYISMGKDFADNFKCAKDVFDEVDDALNEKLSDIIFNGTKEEITLTRNTQPALMATSIAILKTILQESGKNIDELCSFVAGHSLGEFTALCAAKSLSLSDTAKLLRIRGDAMQNAVPSGQGAMAAILGMDISQVQNLCNEVSSVGLCQIANDNCPGQIVISGKKEAIDNAIILAKKLHFKAILLPVSAPFHCDLLEPAKKILADAIKALTFQTPCVPIICNVTVKSESNIEQIKKNLVEQVTHTVRWNETMNFIVNSKVQKVYEIGAGKVLNNMFKRVTKDIEVKSISTIDNLSEIIINN